MRINGVAGGLKQKKSLSEYVKSSISYFMIQVHAENPPKIDIIDRSRKKFEKIRKSAFRVFDYLSNKKNSLKLVQWLLSNGLRHVTMNRQTDRRTDGQTDRRTDRQRADTTIFTHRFFKILDFRSVRFASRNITPLEDNIFKKIVKGLKTIKM